MSALFRMELTSDGIAFMVGNHSGNRSAAIFAGRKEHTGILWLSFIGMDEIEFASLIYTGKQSTVTLRII